MATTFLLFFLLTNSFVDSTSYEELLELKETLKDFFIGKVSQQLFEGKIEEIYPTLLLFCEVEDSLKFPYNNQTLEISCEQVKEAGAEGVAALIFDRIFELELQKLYYKNYTCELLECLEQKEYAYFFSNQARELYASFLPFFGLLSLVGFGLVVVLTRGLGPKLQAVGVCLLSVGIVFFLQPLFLTLALQKIPSEFHDPAKGILEEFSGKIFSGFKYIFFIGLGLVVSGLFFRKLKGKGPVW